MSTESQADKPRVVVTITAEEIRNVLSYCHWIAASKGLRSPVLAKFPGHDHASLIATLRAARALRRSDHFTGLEPRKNLSHVEFLSDGTRRTVSLPRTPSS